MIKTEEYYLSKFRALEFGDSSPNNRGRETFGRGLARIHLADREFDRLLNASSRSSGFTARELEKESLEACRQWYSGWDEADKEAARPSHDSLFDGSSAHLLNKAGGALESPSQGAAP